MTRWLNALLSTTPSFASLFAEPVPPGPLLQDHNWPPDSGVLSSNHVSWPSERPYKSLLLCLKSAAISHYFRDKVPTPQHGMAGTSCCDAIFFCHLSPATTPICSRPPSCRTAFEFSKQPHCLFFLYLYTNASSASPPYFLSPDLHHPSRPNSSISSFGFMSPAIHHQRWVGCFILLTPIVLSLSILALIPLNRNC